MVDERPVDTRPLFQVALDIGFNVSEATGERYKEVYGAIHRACFKPCNIIPASLMVKREEYDSSSHVVFFAMGQENADEAVRKAKETGLVRETHIDPLE